LNFTVGEILVFKRIPGFTLFKYRFLLKGESSFGKGIAYYVVK
jgi:hypothetical protein